MARKKQSKATIAEDAQVYYAQTGSILAKALFAVVIAVISLIPFWYLHSHYGPAAVMITIGALLLVVVVAGLIMMGVATSNRAQENFIEALGELKGVLAPVAREQSKTAGTVERANVEVAKRQLLNEMATEQRQAPQIEDQQMRDEWIGTYEDADTVDGEIYQIR